MVRFKCIIFFLLFILPLTITSSRNIHGQSYTIKNIIKNRTKIFPGTKLTILYFVSTCLSMNNGGDVIFYALLSDNTRAIFLYSNGNLKLIVRSTLFQPLNESVFLNLSAAAMNDNGVIVFSGNFSGKQGIYKYSDDNFEPLIVAGDPITGLESTIVKIEGSRISLNNMGEIAFNARLSDGGRGLFLFTGESIKPVMLVGDTFPFFSESSHIFVVRSANINDKGELVFMAGIKDNDVNMSAPIIFLFRDEKITPITLPGQEIPGTNSKIFADIKLIDPVIGNNSKVIFWAYYATPGRQIPTTSIGTKVGLFLWSSTNIESIILFAHPVPGLKDFYRNLGSFLGPHAINDLGNFVSGFVSTVNKGGIMLFTDNNTVPVFLGKYLKLETEIVFIDASDLNNNDDIVFLGSDASTNMGIFIAKREDVILSIIEVKRINITTDSRRDLKIIGSGFQPGARVSFSGNGIRTFSSEFKTSTTLIATIQIQPDARPGFRDVIVTNPAGGETVFENGFIISR